MRREERRAQTPLLAVLVERFKLNENDLKDSRIDKLLAHKLSLDAEVAQLASNGVREARRRRYAKMFGFSDEEFDADWRIARIIQSIFDARTYLATLKTPKRGDVNVKN